MYVVQHGFVPSVLVSEVKELHLVESVKVLSY